MKNAYFVSAVFVLITAVGLAEPALAQTPTAQSARPAGRVEIEVLDADAMAAIDAESNGIKRGELTPDKQNKNRLIGVIPVPAGDSGTVYVKERDGIPVLDLVSEGQPAPAGAKAVGKYKDGGRVTLPAGTFRTAAAGATQPAATGRGTYSVGFSIFGGTASPLDWVKNGCDEILRELEATGCAGDDRKPAFMVDAELRRYLTDRVYAGVSANFTKPSDSEKAFNGMFDGETFTGTGALALRRLGLEGVLGARLHDRFSVSLGAGFSHFKATQMGTFTFLGETDRDEQEFSDIGPNIRGGVEFRLINNFWISADASRGWMKDPEFEVRLSAWRLGMKILLGDPIW